MKPIRTFYVKPRLPTGLERLSDLAYNLRWAWDPQARSLFRRLDDDLWERSDHNPVYMLGAFEQTRLEEAARDPAFVAHYTRCCRDLDDYMQEPATWFRATAEGSEGLQVAYFSAEFGITGCLPGYSGGLGVLAGEHLKSASDLDLPMVGVGLLYQRGYFRQYLNADGWQQEGYAECDFHTMPVRPVADAAGAPLRIDVEMAGRQVTAQVWYAQVGRIQLYLLDTNIPGNPPFDRDITDELYGGDGEMRLRQEMLLGIGGMRALGALGIRPMVCHMNEGHTAFLALERVRSLMREAGIDFGQAREAVAVGNVFTTHTPVAAGNDFFAPDLVERYFGTFYRELGLDRDSFLGLGRQDPKDRREEFCMTTLALRLSRHNNAVSRLHERVARRMWASLWPGAPVDEVPIGHVTNGVHIESWISHDMGDLFDAYVGPRWRDQPGDPSAWTRVPRIPAEEMWRIHERRRERMVHFVRRRLHRQLENRGVSSAEREVAREVLDPGALTIGWARRFAAYKRGDLLLHDLDRLQRLIQDAERPVQLIFAGKAHPKDEQGKEVIRTLIHTCRRPAFRPHIVFLEDYDLDIARFLVQGCDVWLNTPRRPLEASGTSGMKAAANGVLHASVLDGWWEEAYQPDLGWAIGRGEEYGDSEYVLQDQIESQALYDLLEKEIVPLFYERDDKGVPRGWVARMASAMEAFNGHFASHRMVREYGERLYIPAGRRTRDMADEGYRRAKALAAWKTRVRQAWPRVTVAGVEIVDGPPPGGYGAAPPEVLVGDQLRVRSRVQLGQLAPDDVLVELYIGRVNAGGEIVEAGTVAMESAGDADGAVLFETTAEPCRRSGLHGYTVRVRPRHADLVDQWEMGLVCWADGAVQVRAAAAG